MRSEEQRRTGQVQPGRATQAGSGSESRWPGGQHLQRARVRLDECEDAHQKRGLLLRSCKIELISAGGFAILSICRK